MKALTKIAPVEELKQQAKRLRDRLRGSGHVMSHSESLELLAQQHGVRDWNTLRALAERSGSENRMLLQVGDRVKGRYLGQPFTAEVRSLTSVGDGARRRLTVQFDEPVDVVTFDSFSSFRRRVSVEIGWDGRSARRTSNGEPHMVVMPE
ncbi:MAG: hypothetical protein GJ676_19030 [Rhodobacteraceae bacterium]|nr:hypothetical protein [Paracoccaceae bacterium]